MLQNNVPAPRARYSAVSRSLNSIHLNLHKACVSVCLCKEPRELTVQRSSLSAGRTQHTIVSSGARANSRLTRIKRACGYLRSSAERRVSSSEGVGFSTRAPFTETETSLLSDRRAAEHFTFAAIRFCASAATAPPNSIYERRSRREERLVQNGRLDARRVDSIGFNGEGPTAREDLRVPQTDETKTGGRAVPRERRRRSRQLSKQ